MPGFIEVVVQVPSRRGRRRRRRMTFTTRSSLRCTFTAGVPPDLAERLLATALAWKGRGPDGYGVRPSLLQLGTIDVDLIPRLRILTNSKLPIRAHETSQAAPVSDPSTNEEAEANPCPPRETPSAGVASPAPGVAMDPPMATRSGITIDNSIGLPFPTLTTRAYSPACDWPRSW